MNKKEIEFVPYDVAVVMKELGFDESCLGYYDGQNIPMCRETNHCNQSAPLYQQAFRFLLPLIEHKTIENYVFRVILIKKNGNFLLQRKYYTQGNSFDNYSDGTNEDCLRKLIEIVKENL